MKNRGSLYHQKINTLSKASYMKLKIVTNLEASANHVLHVDKIVWTS